MAKLTEFDRGALMAVSVLLGTHDQPTIAADVLGEMGLERADCSDLTEYDKRNLRIVQGERGIRLRGLGRKRRHNDQLEARSEGASRSKR
ncbi:MAG TPA: hypothetical protein DDW98_09055 [Gammaproteobacteria bacterium]|jgi:hypothetical protein|nr:hypothetical protein [Gammaproteobacteria bacterium]